MGDNVQVASGDHNSLQPRGRSRLSLLGITTVVTLAAGLITATSAAAAPFTAAATRPSFSLALHRADKAEAMRTPAASEPITVVYEPRKVPAHTDNVSGLSDSCPRGYKPVGGYWTFYDPQTGRLFSEEFEDLAGYPLGDAWQFVIAIRPSDSEQHILFEVFCAKQSELPVVAESTPNTISPGQSESQAMTCAHADPVIGWGDDFRQSAMPGSPSALLIGTKPGKSDHSVIADLVGQPPGGGVVKTTAYCAKISDRNVQLAENTVRAKSSPANQQVTVTEGCPNHEIAAAAFPWGPDVRFLTDLFFAHGSFRAAARVKAGTQLHLAVACFR